MPEQLYGWTKRDIDWLLRLLADLRSGKAQILRRREATSAPNVQVVKASSATPTSGRYPGHWFEYDPAAKTYTQKDEVWIVTHNGEVPDTSTYFESTQHGFENSRPVFAAPDAVVGMGTGTTITVREVDGTPSYGSIDTVEFDQADGFSVTNPSAGVARIDLTIDGQSVSTLTITDTLTLSTATLTSTGSTFNIDTNSTFNFTGSEIYLDSSTIFQAYYITTVETTAPSTPASGYGRIYEKSDGKLYFINDAGTEFDLTAGASAASGARAYHSTTQTVTSTSTGALAMDSERYDTDTFHDNSTNNSRLTVPSTAKYHFACVVEAGTSSPGVTGTWEIRLRLNAATTISQGTVAIGTSPLTRFTSISADWSCTASDYVTVELVNNTSGTLTMGMVEAWVHKIK